MSDRVAVLHLVDTLAVGGAEQMAVNIANALPRERFEPHLCATRAEGPLAAAVASDVGRLWLARQHRWDLLALARLVDYIRRHRIRLLHAHSASLLVADLVSLAAPHPLVVWHDHHGAGLAQRAAWPYRVLARRARAVIAVNAELADWACRRLHVPAERIRYVPNFVQSPPPGGAYAAPGPVELPGEAGARVACVANLRPQKDHATLLRAFAAVVRTVPRAHLLLLGAAEPARVAWLRAEVAALSLERHVTWLGTRADVPAILHACSIGVLSSRSEGLPLALLDYGTAGLCAVATDVGQCAEVLDHGRAGVLVPPAAPEALADAVAALLRDRARRGRLGTALRRRVGEHFSAARAVREIGEIYDRVLASTPAGATSPERAPVLTEAG